MQALIPESSPFTDEQRAWRNGFVAGLLGIERALAVASPPIEKSVSTGEAVRWHDPTLALEGRRKLAEDRPIALQMMAAMGQLDCGQCGYLCKSYSEAIAGGTETDLGKCVPGARATAKKLKELVAQAGALSTAPGAQKAERAGVERGYGRGGPVRARRGPRQRPSRPGG